MTPPINTVGYSNLELRFRHYFDSYETGGVQLKIQSSTDGVNWTDEAWNVTTDSSNIGPELIITRISHNLNSPTSYIGFVITGNLYFYDIWCLDDIFLTLPSNVVVDFNNDGQEDILWRYQGSGAYQGLNVIWLMNQSGTSSPIPLQTSQAATGKPSVVMGSKSLETQLTPQEIGYLRTTVSKGGIKSVLQGGRAPDLTPAQIMRDPLEHKGALLPSKRGRLRDRIIMSVPARKDAADPSTLSSGETEIAALQLKTEIAFSQVADTNWQIAGADDFDGDGDTDILWRNYGSGAYQGLNVIWYMTGASKDSEVVFSQVLDTNWQIVGTGDFDGDGDTDILWRNYGSGAYQGLNVIWYMTGASKDSEVVFSQVLDTNWQIAVVGDFDGDGDTDILWRNYGSGAYQGLNVIWYMTGASKDSEVVFSQVLDTNWQIAGTGDFDGDSDTDILWRYYGAGAYQGLNVIWYMSGASKDTEAVFGQTQDTNWRIVNR